MSSTRTHIFWSRFFFSRTQWKVKVSIYFFLIQSVGVGVLFVWALHPSVLMSCDSGFLVHADTVRVTLEYTGVGKSCLSQTTYQTAQMLGTGKGAAAESHQVGRIWVLPHGSQSGGINREHGENHLHKLAF